MIRNLTLVGILIGLAFVSRNAVAQTVLWDFETAGPLPDGWTNTWDPRDTQRRFWRFAGGALRAPTYAPRIEGEFMDTTVTSPAFISASQAGSGSGVAVATLVVTIAYDPSLLGKVDNSGDAIFGSLLRDGTSLFDSLFDLPLGEPEEWASLDRADGAEDRLIVLTRAVESDTRYRLRLRAYDWDIDPSSFAGFGIVEVSATNGKLAPSFLAGDYNRNNIVDAADYTVWRQNVGAAAGTLSNDADGGVIGAKQYQTWKKNFGSKLGAGSVAAPVVPEPAGVSALVSLAIFCWPGFRPIRQNAI